MHLKEDFSRVLANKFVNGYMDSECAAPAIVTNTNTTNGAIRGLIGGCFDQIFVRNCAAGACQLRLNCALVAAYAPLFAFVSLRNT